MILDGFPKILWINLDKSTKRRSYMEKLLNSYNLEHIRIPAIDGTNPKNLEFNNICIPNNNFSSMENACTCSHIMALKYFVENIRDDKIIIFEDDVSFEFLKFIPFNWSDLMNNLPKNYHVIQLAITHMRTINNYLIKTNPNMKYFCSAAYLITKTGAKKILERYYNPKIDKINLSEQQYITADSMILSVGNTYSIPIFTYKILDSLIHPLHLYIHRLSKKRQILIWMNIMNNLKTFDKNVYFSKFEKDDS